MDKKRAIKVAIQANEVHEAGFIVHFGPNTTVSYLQAASSGLGVSFHLISRGKERATKREEDGRDDTIYINNRNEKIKLEGFVIGENETWIFVRHCLYINFEATGNWQQTMLVCVFPYEELSHVSQEIQIKFQGMRVLQAAYSSREKAHYLSCIFMRRQYAKTKSDITAKADGNAKSNMMIWCNTSVLPISGALRKLRMVVAKPRIAFLEYGDEMQSTIAMQGLQSFKITADHPMVITNAKK
ncbi:hypothetical protein LguiB_030458 [Lonicera macranthoides]